MSLDLAALYADYHRPLRGYVARRMLGHDDATIDDLVSDVFERACRAAGRYHERGLPLEAWLYRIARNLLIDRYRERSRPVVFVRLGDLKPYIDHVGTSDHVARIDARATVARLLPHLTESQRAVAVARVMEGRSVRQTAEMIGRTEDGVKKLQDRALVNLRRLVGAA